MRKYLWLLLLLFTNVAFATTYNVNSSMSESSLWSSISGASAGDTVNFAAGTYAWSGQHGLTCGVTYTGPVNSNFFANVFNPNQDVTANTPTQPTAIINSSNGSSIFSLSGCSSTGPTTTIAWLWGQNISMLYDDGSGNNVAFLHNWCTGIAPNTLNTGNQTSCFFIDGSGATQVSANFLIEYNQFGDSTSCGAVFALTYGNAPGGNPDWGGLCAGVFTNTGKLTNLVVEYNFFYHMEEHVKLVQRGSFGQGVQVSVCDNCSVRYNFMYGFKRIVVEDQVTTDSGAGVVGINVSDNALGWGISNLGSSFGLSMACCTSNGDQTANPVSPADYVNDDLITAPPDTEAGSILENGCECWGVGLTMNNNFLEGRMANYFLVGSGQFAFATDLNDFGNPQWTVNNNYICTDNNPNGFNLFNNEENDAQNQGNTPTNLIFEGVNNPFGYTAAAATVSSTCNAQTSSAPTISPSGGSQTFPLVVNMSTTGQNTSIYYTTDGSQPVPGSGTAKLYSGAITLTGAATLKAVGMWGVPPQPTSYIADKTNGVTYGFVPSSVATAAFTGGGGTTPTAIAPSLNPAPPFTFSTAPLTINITQQTSGAIAHCTLDGSTPTGSSNTFTSISISATTTVSCLSTAAGFNNSSVVSGVYTFTQSGGGGGGGGTPSGGCQVPPNSSLGTITNAINSAAANSCASPNTNMAFFQGGTSNIAWNGGGSAINVPCPTTAGMVITGPTTSYMQNGVANGWVRNVNGTLTGALPQATIRNTNGGESYQLISLPGGCQNPITITYLEIDGNRPQSGGGAIFINGNGGGPSAATSNITIEYNWFHGNQEITPTVCGTGCVAYEDNASSEIWLDGFNGGAANNGTYLTNTTIDYNIFGNGNPSNPSAGDCGNVMVWAGVCTNTSTGDGCNFIGYDTTGGQCAALGNHTNTTNFHFDYNKIIQEEQGTKWYEGGGGGPSSPYSLFFQTNDTMNNNDIGTYHRIGTEDQQSSQTYSPVQGTCTLDAEGDCLTHRNNDMHDNYVPAFGNWGFSLANTGFRDDSNNVMITNDASGTGGGGPGDFEDFSTYFGVNNNFSQGSISCSVQFGGNNTIESSSSVSNNIFQNPNGSYPSSCGLQFSINSAHGGTPANMTNNSGTTNCCSTLQSTSTSLSPNGGSFSGSVVVTITNNGNTSGQGPQGNTNSWCTTDGSTPVPQSGTSMFYPNGYQLTLTSSTNLKCVGMWGSQNQLAPYTVAGGYPSGGYYANSTYGYTASGVVSATFTINGGGVTPTVGNPNLSPAPPFTFSPPLTINITQTTSGAVSHCTLDGSTPTSSSTVYSSITISATTTVQCISTLSGSNNSNVVGGTYSVGSSGPTLISVTTSLSGGGSTIGVNGTVQAVATCGFSDGSSSPCSGANAVSSWNSSNPAIVTISSSGLVTGVTMGTANVWAIAGGITGSVVPITVNSVTLSGLNIATTGGITSLTVAATNQIIATCLYSDGSQELCNNTDAKGDSVSAYTTTNTTVASVSTTGLVTALAGGTTQIGAYISGNAPTLSQLGVTNQDQPGAVTYAGAMNSQYMITGTNTGGYTVNSCSFYLAAGTQASGQYWDCVLSQATSATTQQAAALCSARYTTTGTASPAAWVTINMTGCGTLLPSQGYWLGITTNQGGPVPQGAYDCGGTCSGGAPTSGVGTYGYFGVLVPTFGNYSAQSTSFSFGPLTTQSSQYLNLSATGSSTNIVAAPIGINVVSATGVTTLQGISIKGLVTK